MNYEAFLFVIFILANVCDGKARHAGPSGSSSSKGGAGTLSGGAIAGLVCGVLAAAALVAILILLKAGVLQKWCRSCRRSSRSDATMRYAADVTVAGDSSRQYGVLTAPSAGAANINSSSYSNNNSINDNKSQEDGSSARYRGSGSGPPPSYDHVISQSTLQSPYPYKAPDELPPFSGSTQQETYPGHFTGGLTYAGDPGSGLPFATAYPGGGLPHSANPGSGLLYTTNPAGNSLPYSANSESGLPYTTSPEGGVSYFANPGSGLPYTASPGLHSS